MKFFTTIALLVLMLPAIAQPNAVTANEDILVITTPSAMPENTLLSFSGGKTNIEGNKYLEENALEGIVTLKGSKNEYLFRKMRCNIFSNDLEVELQGSTKYIRNLRVKSFTLKKNGKTTKFISAVPFVKNDKPQKGYLEVIEDGKVQLVKHTYTDILSSNYNITLNVGSKADKITQKSAYFLAKDGKLYNAKLKRKIKQALKHPQFNTKAVVKEKGLKMKRIKDLKALVKLYNAQVGE